MPNPLYFVGIHQGGGDMDPQNLTPKIQSSVAPFRKLDPDDKETEKKLVQT